MIERFRFFNLSFISEDPKKKLVKLDLKLLNHFFI